MEYKVTYEGVEYLVKENSLGYRFAHEDLFNALWNNEEIEIDDTIAFYFTDEFYSKTAEELYELYCEIS